MIGFFIHQAAQAVRIVVGVVGVGAVSVFGFDSPARIVVRIAHDHLIACVFDVRKQIVFVVLVLYDRIVRVGEGFPVSHLIVGIADGMFSGIGKRGTGKRGTEKEGRS